MEGKTLDDLRGRDGIVSVEGAAVVSDPCGLIRVLYNTPSLSVAHVDVAREAEPHRHETTEEVYFVLMGAGKVVIGDDSYSVSEGDLIPIPKGTWHYLTPLNRTILPVPFEILAVTHPRFMPEDMIFRDGTTLASRLASTSSR